LDGAAALFAAVPFAAPLAGFIGALAFGAFGFFGCRLLGESSLELPESASSLFSAALPNALDSVPLMCDHLTSSVMPESEHRMQT
jgi:hypothetical protein